MEYKTNSGIWGTMFGVPCVVADNFLKLASADQLKVLLYLLRYSGKNCSDEEISLNTGVSPQQTADAMLFWQQVNVLTPQNTAREEVPVASMSVIEEPVNKPVARNLQDQAANKLPERQRQNLTPSEISRTISGSNDIAELFKVAETALGKLSYTQQNSLIWMHNYLGLKREVIVTLIYYCISIEKTNCGYIEKIAYSWAENDINTLTAAQEEVDKLTASHDYTGKIMKLFEMNRKPTSKQTVFLTQWRKAGYSDELLRLAYERTIESIDKLSFEYINGILQNWQEQGLTTKAAVAESENSFRQQKNASDSQSGVSSDIDKYNFIINKF